MGLASELHSKCIWVHCLDEIPSTYFWIFGAFFCQVMVKQRAFLSLHDPHLSEMISSGFLKFHFLSLSDQFAVVEQSAGSERAQIVVIHHVETCLFLLKSNTK